MLSRTNGLSLQRWRATIEYEDRLDPEEKELADAPEKSYDVAIAEGIAFLVTDSFEKLVDPDGRIYGNALLV